LVLKRGDEGCVVVLGACVLYGVSLGESGAAGLGEVSYVGEDSGGAEWGWCGSLGDHAFLGQEFLEFGSQVFVVKEVDVLYCV